MCNVTFAGCLFPKLCVCSNGQPLNHLKDVCVHLRRVLRTGSSESTTLSICLNSFSVCGTHRNDSRRSLWVAWNVSWSTAKASKLRAAITIWQTRQPLKHFLMQMKVSKWRCTARCDVFEMYSELFFCFVFFFSPAWSVIIVMTHSALSDFSETEGVLIARARLLPVCRAPPNTAWAVKVIGACYAY